MKMLDDTGFVRTEKAFVNRRPRTTFAPTAAGRRGFEQYVTVLEGIIASSKPGKAP